MNEKIIDSVIKKNIVLPPEDIEIIHDFISACWKGEPVKMIITGGKKTGKTLLLHLVYSLFPAMYVREFKDVYNKNLQKYINAQGRPVIITAPKFKQNPEGVYRIDLKHVAEKDYRHLKPITFNQLMESVESMELMGFGYHVPEVEDV